MTWHSFIIGFIYASIGSILIPIGCYFLTKRKSRLSRILFIWLLASLLFDVGNLIASSYGIRGYLAGTMFFMVQFTLLSLIYSSLLIKKKMVYSILAAFLIIAFFNFIFFQSINEFQSLLRSLGAVIMIVFSVIYFLDIYRNLPTENLLNYFPGWINTAVFYYFSFNLFLFIGGNYIFKNASPEIGMAFWGFHNFNNIIKNCLLATGLYVCRR